MECIRCNEKVSWGGDEDLDPEDDARGEYFFMVSNFTCPKCDLFYLAYYPNEERQEWQKA